ncbi:MAG: hypothetical protein AAGA23_10225 [Pseudomonadota bacterium]
MSQRPKGTQRVATLHDLMVELGSIELKLERMHDGKPDAAELNTRKLELRSALDQLSR